MCRLMAFPPGTKKEFAVDMCKTLESFNKDGVGSAYVSGTQFVVKKYPISYSETIQKGLDLFNHMPHNGWTIAHVRAASVGGVSMVNTHPFVKGNFCVVHNGHYSVHSTIRKALKGFVNFSGETDSEIAAFLMHRLGPAGLYANSCGDGAFLALSREGSLYVVNTGGDIEVGTIEGKPIVASRLCGIKDSEYYRKAMLKYSKDCKVLFSDITPYKKTAPATSNYIPIVYGTYSTEHNIPNSQTKQEELFLKKNYLPEKVSYRKRLKKCGDGYLWTDYD